jgi:NAD(P)-dependent dehydrogenase (short-subunit alcohol dehydrogenase family)
MRILITGVGRGIGRALAEESVARGWQVIGTLRTGEAPAGVAVHRLDVTDFAALGALSRAVGHRLP